MGNDGKYSLSRIYMSKQASADTFPIQHRRVPLSEIAGKVTHTSAVKLHMLVLTVFSSGFPLNATNTFDSSSLSDTTWLFSVVLARVFSTAIQRLWRGVFTNTKMESVINAPLRPKDKGTSPESGVWGLISKTSVLWGAEEGLLGTTAQRRRP